MKSIRINGFPVWSVVYILFCLGICSASPLDSWARPKENKSESATVHSSGYWITHLSSWPSGSEPDESFLGEEYTWIDVLSGQAGDEQARAFATAYLNIMSGVPVPEDVELAFGQSLAILMYDAGIVDDGIVHVLDRFNEYGESESVQSETSLEGAYPDPFNPTTTIRFRLAEPGRVTLSIFDMIGRKVAILVEGQLDAGIHEAIFDATGFPSGTYVYQLVTPSSTQASSMLLVQ